MEKLAPCTHETVKYSGYRTWVHQMVPGMHLKCKTGVSRVSAVVGFAWRSSCDIVRSRSTGGK